MWWNTDDGRNALHITLALLNEARRVGEQPIARGHLIAAAEAVASVLEGSPPDLSPHDEAFFAEFLGHPNSRLAVYGSLAPGESNHSVIEDVSGEWAEGRVAGKMHDAGWGADHGYPGLVWEPQSSNGVPVKLLTFSALGSTWQRLDAFEGGDYWRILVPVDGVNGETVIANIYAIRDPESGNTQ